MLFSLSNLKRRSVRDADGELAVVPKLLHGRAALKLVGQAIEQFEEYVSRPRNEYDARLLEAVMGDYRLGRCIEACLMTRYSFVQPRLEDLIDPEQLDAVASKGISSPSDLRFALWDAANSNSGGFVPPSERAGFLYTFAEEIGLLPDTAHVDTILSLDTEGSAVLTLIGEKPTPVEIVRLYNRGAVQTLLAHSTHVTFNIGGLPGATLKRLYFVAKRRGVLVDIEQAPGGYSLTLYGPEQAFGTADKYGRRLAEVVISLLRTALASPEHGELSGTAHLVLHDRTYRFHLTADLLDRLEYAALDLPAAKGRIAESGAAYSVGSTVEVDEDGTKDEPLFDSLVEAKLYKEYKSLERQGYTHGWHMEREPEPLLAPGLVLIPDFAFSRGDTKVHMEIAGFWSPSYRERKLAKLKTLAGGESETALILALPKDAIATFAGLPFPVVPYKTGVRATDLLTLLDAHYGQSEKRMDASKDRVEALRQRALQQGYIPEQKIAQALEAYTRTELLSAARALDGEGCRYVPGVGLLSADAVNKAHTALENALANAPERRIVLDEAGNLAAGALAAPKIDPEALVQIWPEWRIERPSLFEAYLVAA